MKVDWLRSCTDNLRILRLIHKLLWVYTVVFAISGLYSQNRNRNWVFSDSIGIKFNQDGTLTQFTANLNGKQRHSCATISDRFGNLKFYAGGSGSLSPYSNLLRIFRRDHGLLGNYPGVVTGLGSLTCQFFYR